MEALMEDVELLPKYAINVFDKVHITAIYTL